MAELDGGIDGEPDAVTAAALRARRGDQAAASAFVRATQADVWRLCSHLGASAGTPGSRSDAEDLTQETYARAFAALHRFSGRSSARTWLLAIARRVCADSVRTAVRGRKIEAAGVEAAGAEGAGHVGDPAESVALRSMLDGLDPQRREAFVLTQLVGLSYAEAADVCGCPVGTIRSRVARARDELVSGFGEGRRRAAGD